MEVSFVETMRGTLKTDAGEESPVEFEVVAAAPQLRRFLLDGHTELRGLLRAPRWVDEAPAHGSLTLSPLALSAAPQKRVPTPFSPSRVEGPSTSSGRTAVTDSWGPVLRYRVAFTGRDGAALSLEGDKHPSLWRPLSSMTAMEVALRGEGGVLARGEMRFDLRELLPFLLSWLPVGRWAQRGLDVRRRRVERERLERR